MIVTTDDNSNYMEKSKKSTIVLVVGINSFILMLLLVPMYTRYWLVLFALANAIFVLFQRNFKILVNNSVILWTIFIMLVILGLLYGGGNIRNGIQFSFALILFLFNHIILSSRNDWGIKTIEILFLVSGFFVMGSIIEIIYPEFILYINKFNLNETQFLMASDFSRWGYITGFTYQTGVNGYAISVFMSLTFLKIFTCGNVKKKVFFSILYIFSFYLLFMTGKRGFILFNAIIFLFLFTKLTKYKVKAFIPMFLFIGCLFIFFSYTQAGENIIMRTVSQTDVTSGRSIMNSTMVEDFLSSPIIGKGTYTTIDAVFAYHGHNIYLQVLREHGLLGFIPFVFLLVKYILKSIKLLKNVQRYSEYKYLVGFSLYMQILFILWGFTGNPLYDMYSLFIYFMSISLINSIQNSFENAKFYH